jgi:hypothetical protein
MPLDKCVLLKPQHKSNLVDESQKHLDESIEVREGESGGRDERLHFFINCHVSKK